MKKLFRFLLMFLLGGLFLGLGGLLALTLYYRSNFPVNTWINGVYCTGKSIEQVNKELVSAQEASVITIVDADCVNWEIDMLAAGIRPDFSDALKAYLRKNASVFWMDNLKKPVSSNLVPGKYVAEEEKLLACFQELPFVAQERKNPEGVKVSLSPEGFVLQDGNTGRLNVHKACDYLSDCLAKGQTVIDLKAGECYEDLADSALDKRQRDIWEQVGGFIARGSRIVYDMGAEQIPLTSAVLSGFLKTGADSSPALGDDGQIQVDEEKVRLWVDALAEDYNTCDTEKQFASTRGDIVTVKYVTYGTKLDAEAEKTYLLEVLEAARGASGGMETAGGAEAVAGTQGAVGAEATSGTGSAAGTETVAGSQTMADIQVPSDTELHVPAYIQKGYVRGLDDIGDTYVEIDMTEQKMYYYANGELELETDVVTGNTGRRMGTPQGINYVHAKQRNQTLRGSDYESFVKYWVPVVGNVGIHDASWRRSFGGKIYQTNGSHGCINTPSGNMSQLYDMLEVGMPVIMFY